MPVGRNLSQGADLSVPVFMKIGAAKVNESNGEIDPPRNNFPLCEPKRDLEPPCESLEEL